MKLTIVAPAYFHNHRPCALLIDSCEQLGLDFLLYGSGEPYPGLIEAKINRLRRELQKLKSEYVLVTDSSDAFMLSGEEEIIDKMVAGVLMSAEKNCYPQEALAKYYPDMASPWCYVNSGGYCGEREAVIELLQAMSTVQTSLLPFRRDRDWMNDQFRASLVYLGGYPLTLDTNCTMFQTMSGVEDGDLEWFDEEIINMTTGFSPCVMHFNGNTPGIERAFNTRFQGLTA